MTTRTDVTDNLQQVRETIAAACARANRSPDEVTLVAVSKQKPTRDILEAIDAGVRHFGENRVKEARDKIPSVNTQTEQTLAWHMVGPVQDRRAAKGVLRAFDVVESVDSVAIAETLSELAGMIDKTLTVLVQVNISGEESKSGFAVDEWQSNAQQKETFWQAIEAIEALPHLDLRGLMTLAPYTDDPEATRPYFAAMAELREALRDDFDIALPDLSMGMTNDYAVAIEEGATIVRVGRAIFGERNG